ncbi:TPA: CusA/CzcA family heavy metal efflux RND transporter, partial [Enterobacter hormaechei subsp. steigerwaltii]|nr:CusA/CzcA family heavy metal efflux RND transporter [Enterobacter hormaechei subsp. steigerwaltii]
EGDGRFEIACEFDDLPDFIMIDDRVQTTLASEHLLNEDGNFEIVKTFKATTSGKPEQTCIRCIHPDEEPLRNLLGMKISELKAVGKEVEKNVADKRTASLWRQAIREAAAPYTCSEIMLDVDKEFGTDTKSLWGKILDLLPTYAIFKADRESSDGDSEAKNPLQQAVKDAQAALQDKITALENEIQDSALDVAQRTLDKLREMAPELASELTPRFKEKPKWTFNFTLDGENGIPINKRGSGIRRLILLNFFRAEAEKNVAGTPRNVIYAIEEPETSQHPNYQMMLMKALLALLIKAYHPLLLRVLHWPKTTLLVAALSIFTVIWPLSQVGGEFLPKINEGDLLYMPSTLPGVSPAEAAALLQTTDKLIKSVPEVASVFGKTGKAQTATDSAPLEMVETTIQLKPEDQWRPGMTIDKIIDELDRTVRLPGLANLWVPPIRNRIDMLSTGIKSPIGIKVSGTVLSDIDATAQSIEAVAKTVPGVVSVLAERLEGGRYIDIDINREKASRYGMTVGDVQLFVSSAIGGAMVGETVEGVARYPINIRYPQDYRNSPQALKQMPILTPMKQQITLGDVADINVVSGPTMLKTENARPASWIYVDARGRDMVSVVNDIKTAISEKVKLRPGTSVAFSGQFELLEHANKKLKLMVPMTVMIIFILLYLAFRRVDEALLILMSLPFALVGGIWFLYWQGFHMSVATGTGFIALAGVAAEFGVVMLMYLRHAIEAHPELSRKETFTPEGLDEALYHGAVLRVRPKAMTVAVIIAGLLPILWGTGAGSEVMSRIAAPMIGGMITAPLLSLFIIPAAYKLIWLRRHKKSVS